MSFEVRIRHRIGQCSLALDFRSDARLTALVGPSGVGKTSALNCIAGLERPAGGRIVAGDAVLFDSAEGIDLKPEKRRIGYVFQDARLFPHLSVAANLAYGQDLNRRGERLVGREALIDLLGLAHLLERHPPTLSGGETRRVAIGRALLAAPRLLLLDEPFASLDAARAARLRALVERIRDSLEVPILLVSHDPAEVAQLAGRVVEMTAPAASE